MSRPAPDSAATPWISPGPGGVRLRIRAVPGARRDAVLGTHGQSLRVAVRAAPEAGRANDALVALLARELGVASRDVEVLSGRAGRDKVLAVKGIDQPSALARIERALGPEAAPGAEDPR